MNMANWRIRVCRVCGEPFESLVDADLCMRCDCRKTASFDVRRLSIDAHNRQARAEDKAKKQAKHDRKQRGSK